MSHHSPNNTKLTPAQKEKRERAEHHDSRLDYVFRRILHWLERIIAALTIVVLVLALCMEGYNTFVVAGYPANFEEFLLNITTIVVGLEFVRMLIDTTPANILEVLTVAITRQVILSHDDYWNTVACVACIAGLFAVRRFLIRRSELQEEMVEID